MSTGSVHITIRGRVQGLGFRHFIKHKAEQLQISGWVKNTPNGSVEIKAEGETASLATFIEWAKVGPSRAEIDSFEIEKTTPSGEFLHFAIG